MSYREISDYGVIGDTQSAALIDSYGSIDWLCWPRFDSPAVFLRILDDKRGGFFTAKPAELKSRSRRYLEGTNILETTFHCASGTLVLTDFMPLSASPGNSKGQDARAEQRLIRLLRCTEGDAECEIELRPTFSFGREAATIKPLDSSRLVFHSPTGSLHAQLGFAWRDKEEAAVTASAQLRAGDCVPLVLTWTEPGKKVSAVPLAAAERTLKRTREYWQKWSEECLYEGEFRDLVVRSALALKLLIYEPTGAVIAAPTTSLPETIGGERNWDYRFSWVRDSSLTMVALMNLGYFAEAHDFFHFLHRSLPEDASEFQVMYRVDGGEDVPEKDLSWLSGYRDSRPVRIGNGAAHQTQLDIFGELLHCAELYWSHHGFEHRGESFQRGFWPTVQSAANYIARNWQQPGNGIWEIRGPKRRFTHATGMCCEALECAVRLAREHGTSKGVHQWEQVAEKIRRDFVKHGFNREVGAYTQSYGSTAMDASILRLPLLGVVDSHGERMRATVAELERRLMRNGLMYRYRIDETEDGLQGQEGAFTACAFWLAENYVLQGRLGAAEDQFRHVVSFANDLGLLSEELNPDTGEQLGNFPQGFTHIGLINAAVRLAAAKRGESPDVSRAPVEGKEGQAA